MRAALIRGRVSEGRDTHDPAIDAAPDAPGPAPFVVVPR
jgi:hypothetical protein